MVARTSAPWWAREGGLRPSDATTYILGPNGWERQVKRHSINFDDPGNSSSPAANYKPEPKPRKKGKVVRGTIFGYSATSVIRWCGQQGWNAEDTGVMLAYFGLGSMSDTTIDIQLRAGRVNDASRGPAAPIDAKQAKMLDAART